MYKKFVLLKIHMRFLRIETFCYTYTHDYVRTNILHCIGNRKNCLQSRETNLDMNTHCNICVSPVDQNATTKPTVCTTGLTVASTQQQNKKYRDSTSCTYNLQQSSDLSGTISNTVIDIRSDKSVQNPLHINTHMQNPDLDMLTATATYNQVKPFDSMIDKALDKLNKKSKQKSQFGKPNKNYSFIREPTFNNVLLLLYKSGYFSHNDITILSFVHPMYNHLYTSITCSINIDFTTLLNPDPKWESQKKIPFSKKLKLLACAIYFNFNIPQMIRYLGGQYTGDDRDVQKKLENIRGIVPDKTVAHVK